MHRSETSQGIHRRIFLRGVGVAAAAGLAVRAPAATALGAGASPAKRVKVVRTDSDFEREPMVRPFGFKGGYMTEMWQTASLLEGESGERKIGLGTQSVLYSDADVFTAHSEAAGNALMYALTDESLRIITGHPFVDPVGLFDDVLPTIYAAGQKLTGRSDLKKIFALNAYVGVDNAAWLLYAASNGMRDFDAMIPAKYKPALSHRNEKVAIIYLASYNLPVADLRRAVTDDGYFVIKVKMGQPGTQAEMLEKDKTRLSEVHAAIKDLRTPQTPSGKLIYTLDANGRYERKETLMQLIDHAKKIGAFDQLLFFEEPLAEENDEDVSDVGVRIGADESAHDEEGVLRRLQQGYGLIVLKGIAKTLSLSMKMATLAHERGVPCMCADLTVNPILIDWHKNLAARLEPFPGLRMGLLETNGDLNYRNWQEMITYHPAGTAPWTRVRQGAFDLGDDFYARSGGIFESSPHYQAMFAKV